jgi:tetratricopeptide (TPR) repeat protein
MKTRQTRIQCVCVLLLLVVWPAWAQEGQSELDKAMDLKITADSLQDLADVAALCEKALEKGLAKEDEAFARQLLTGALYERASQMCQPIVLRAPVMDQQLKELRERVMPDLEKIIKHNGQFGPAHLLIAQLQTLEGGDAQRARESVDRAIECLTDDHKMLVDALLLRSGLPTTVADPLADLKRAVELAPDNPDVWQARAMYYLRRGEVEKAVSDFNSLLDKDSDNMLTRLAVAEALIKVEQYDEALKHINLVIEKKPSSLAYTLRAQLWTRQEKLDDAVKDLDEAAKLAPDDLGLLLMRARLYLAAGRNALAQQDVERVLQTRPDALPAIELRSSILAAMGKFTEAAKDMTELLKKEPDNILLKLQLAMYLHAGNQSRQAIEAFGEVLRVDPQNGFALRGRADAYLNVGEHRKAVTDYEVAIKMFADDSAILNNFAWVLATSPEDEIRDGKRAVEMGLKACELTQYQQAHILSTLAAAYAETGDFETAVKWSQKSVDLGDQDIQEQLKQELESYQRKKPWREKKQEPATEPAKKDDAATAR